MRGYSEAGIRHSHIYLYGDQQADASAHFGRVSVHSCHHVHDGLADGNDHAKHCKHKKTVFSKWGTARSGENSAGTPPVRQAPGRRTMEMNTHTACEGLDPGTLSGPMA